MFSVAKWIRGYPQEFISNVMHAYCIYIYGMQILAHTYMYTLYTYDCTGRIGHFDKGLVKKSLCTRSVKIINV